MNSLTDRITSLTTGLLFSASALAIDLRTEPFWQSSQGIWANHSTYLNGDLEYKIKSYHSITAIDVKADHVTIKETKYYPPGGFYGAAIGLTIDKNEGVEFITITTASAIMGTSDVIMNDGKANRKTTITPLNKDTAMLAASEKGSVIDDYRMFITIPDNNHRFVSNLGIDSKALGSSAGALKGVSFFNGKRISESEIKEQLNTWRDLYQVGSVVTFSDGKYQHQKL